MKTAIYVRVSTEEQAQEGYSIRAQEQKLKDYARIREWSIYNIYIDEGISGKNITERPAINSMIEDIESGHVNNVLVFKIDRLTRSTGDLAYLIDLFSQYDCAFNSLMESIDTQTASGRMFIKIIGIFAEFERENISERTKIGLERKAREGYSLGVVIPSYGYDRKIGQKIQTINEVEAEIVKEIFDMYVKQGKPITGIAKMLNMRKIPTKCGSLWRPTTVRDTLKNCNYIGKVRYAIDDKKRGFETKGLHEPIIETEVFEQAQQLLAKNRKITKTKKPLTANYYAGFLYCPDCGKKLNTHNQYNQMKDGNIKQRCSYVCEFAKCTDCTFRTVAQSKIERAFEEYMEKMPTLEPIEEIDIKQQQKQEKTKELLQAYTEKLNKLKSRENETLDLYIDGAIEFQEYRNMTTKIDKDKSEIQTEIDKLEIEEESPSSISIEDVVLEFRANWKFLKDEEKRHFLTRFVKRIEITATKPPNSQWVVAVKNVDFA